MRFFRREKSRYWVEVVHRDWLRYPAPSKEWAYAIAEQLKKQFPTHGIFIGDREGSKEDWAELIQCGKYTQSGMPSTLYDICNKEQVATLGY